MEPAQPIAMITPNSEMNLDLIEIKNYNIPFKNKDYLIQIGKTSSKERIGFKIKENSSELNNYYEKFLSLIDLQNINRTFKMFDNIDEAYKNIDALFQRKNATIMEKNDQLSLNFEVNQLINGKEIIEIYLEKKSLSLQEINIILENDVKNLKSEMKQIKDYNESLKKDIENIKKEFKEENQLLKEEIESLKNENKAKNILINEILEKLEKLQKAKNNVEINNQNENKNKNKDNLKLEEKEEELCIIENKIIEKEEVKLKINIDSKIIDKKEDLYFIENRLKDMEQFRNKNMKYTLIFRGTEDGELPSEFHKKVDEIDKTLTIIETTKGSKFGGYIDKKWDSNSEWVKDDENCFVFSLNLNKIYNPVKDARKYYFRANHGPTFSVFGLKNNLFDSSKLNLKTKDKANERFTEFNEDYELTGGENEFKAKEIEVFKIETQ